MFPILKLRSDTPEILEEEVPEEYHEALEELFEPHYEAHEEALEEVEVGARELAAAIEDEGLLEESGACVRVEDAAGRAVASSFGDVSATVVVGDRFTLVQADGAEPLEGRPATLESDLELGRAQ